MYTHETLKNCERTLNCAHNTHTHPHTGFIYGFTTHGVRYTRWSTSLLELRRTRDPRGASYALRRRWVLGRKQREGAGEDGDGEWCDSDDVAVDLRVQGGEWGTQRLPPQANGPCRNLLR